ncbi:MAG: glycoside hydrolase family 57 protein [Bacteroidaceae bacterium]|jgi:alpha-amylase|nr:glycoside hydrolase family 57 protein [Bacteroidaceae bacterium]
MKTICLYFEIHQIIHLKRYRFFDIGTDHYYYDDYANDTSITNIAENSYIPALKTLIDMARKSEGAFKVALSLSGVGLEQLERYAPTVIDLLQELAQTGCCEFIAEPYSHGLASLAPNGEQSFREEVKRQVDKINQLFGQKPKIFRNSSLIYDDEIGGLVADMGFKGVLTEGAKHILGWKSPHYLYHCSVNPNLKVLMRDYKLSDDISLRFSNSSWEAYPLMADKYIDWIAQSPEEDGVFNIFMELCALGIYQPLSSNILEFLSSLPAAAKARGIGFQTPSEVIKTHKSVSAIDVPYPMSWNDEERDISCWLGNVMQREAFNKLYSIGERVILSNDKHLRQDWDYLQASNNFRFMTTKNNAVSMDRGIYESPYDAFTNYMNVLGDFLQRVNWAMPLDIDTEELNAFQTTISNQDKKIQALEKQVARLKSAAGEKKKN